MTSENTKRQGRIGERDHGKPIKRDELSSGCGWTKKGFILEKRQKNFGVADHKEND